MLCVMRIVSQLSTADCMHTHQERQLKQHRSRAYHQLSFGYQQRASGAIWGLTKEERIPDFPIEQNVRTHSREGKKRCEEKRDNNHKCQMKVQHFYRLLHLSIVVIMSV